VEHASGIARQMVGRWGISPAIEECYEQALATLRGSRDRLDRLARASWTGRPWKKTKRMPQTASAPAAPRAAIARGEAPGATTAPGNPLAAAQAGAHHIAPAPSR